MLRKLDIHTLNDEAGAMFLTKMSTKWMKDLNIGPLETAGGKYRQCISRYRYRKDHFRKGSNNTILRTDKYDHMKASNFCKAKEAIITVNRCCMERKKSVLTTHQIADLCLEYTENCKN